MEVLTNYEVEIMIPFGATRGATRGFFFLVLFVLFVCLSFVVVAVCLFVFFVVAMFSNDQLAAWTARRLGFRIGSEPALNWLQTSSESCPTTCWFANTSSFFLFLFVFSDIF